MDGKIRFEGNFVLLVEFNTYVRLSSIQEIKYDIIGSKLELSLQTSSSTYRVSISCAEEIKEYESVYAMDYDAKNSTEYSAKINLLNKKIEENCFKILKKFIDKKEN